MKKFYAIVSILLCCLNALCPIRANNTRSNEELANTGLPANDIKPDSLAGTSSKVMVCISSINVLNIRFPKIPLIDFWHVCLTMPDGSCLGFYPRQQEFGALLKATIGRVKGWFTVGNPEQCFTTNYEPDTVKTAIANTMHRYRHYNLFFKNCQHFVNDVLTECEKLTKQHKP